MLKLRQTHVNIDYSLRVSPVCMAHVLPYLAGARLVHVALQGVSKTDRPIDWVTRSMCNHLERFTILFPATFCLSICVSLPPLSPL